jgi:hypothetical protein
MHIIFAIIARHTAIISRHQRSRVDILPWQNSYQPLRLTTIGHMTFLATRLLVRIELVAISICFMNIYGCFLYCPRFELPKLKMIPALRMLQLPH